MQFKYNDSDISSQIFALITANVSSKKINLIRSLSSFTLIGRTLYVYITESPVQKVNSQRKVLLHEKIKPSIHSILEYRIYGCPDVIIDKESIKSKIELLINELNKNCECEFRTHFESTEKELNKTNKILNEISKFIRKNIDNKFRGKYTLTYFDNVNDEGYHFFDTFTLNDIMDRYITIEHQHSTISPFELISYLILEKLNYSRSLTKKAIESNSIETMKWSDVEYIDSNPLFYIGATNFHSSEQYSILPISNSRASRHVLSIGISSNLAGDFNNEITKISKEIYDMFSKINSNRFLEPFKPFFERYRVKGFGVGIGPNYIEIERR